MFNKTVSNFLIDIVGACTTALLAAFSIGFFAPFLGLEDYIIKIFKNYPGFEGHTTAIAISATFFYYFFLKLYFRKLWTKRTKAVVF
jgi:hypothetical protein